MREKSYPNGHPSAHNSSGFHGQRIQKFRRGRALVFSSSSSSYSFPVEFIRQTNSRKRQRPYYYYITLSSFFFCLKCWVFFLSFYISTFVRSLCCFCVHLKRVFFFVIVQQQQQQKSVWGLAKLFDSRNLCSSKSSD